MAISYEKINNEVFKIARGMGYSIKMFDENGNGPISNPELAMYMYLEPDGIMLSMPQGNSTEYDEVLFYKGKLHDEMKFKNLIKRVRNVTRLYNVGITIREFGGDHKVSPDDFAHRVKADRERKDYDAMNESKEKFIKRIRELNKK